MLQSFADSLARSAWRRSLFFLIAALISIASIGYYFGTFDQVIHIPFLKKFADPSLYNGDSFFEMRFQHFSFFWFFFIPFYNLKILEITMFVIHIIATFLTFQAIWKLSMQLFNNSLSSMLGVLLCIFPHTGFAGFPIIEFSLLNRTFVLPFLLWAIILYLRQYHWRSFFILGIMYNLHVISVNFVIGMFMFDCLLRFRQIGFRRILGRLGIFIIGALPVLIWRINSPAVEIAPLAEWFSVISNGMFVHIVNPLAPNFYTLAIAVNGFSAFVLFWVGYRVVSRQDEIQRKILHFVYAVALILVLQIISAYLFPVTIVIQFQIIRAGLFVMIFGYLYFANYLSTLYQAGQKQKNNVHIVTATAAVSCFPVIPVMVWAVERFLSNRKWQIGVSTAVVIANIIIYFVAITNRVMMPGFAIYGPQNAWNDAQRWARDNTPKEAVFISPPYTHGMHDSEWRVFSERSILATHTDLLEIALVPGYLDTWKERFVELAPGALQQFRGDYFENIGITYRAFYTLKAQDFQRIAGKYSAGYLVVEKPNHYDELKLVYENDGVLIYQMR